MTMRSAMLGTLTIALATACGASGSVAQSATTQGQTGGACQYTAALLDFRADLSSQPGASPEVSALVELESWRAALDALPVGAKNSLAEVDEIAQQVKTKTDAMHASLKQVRETHATLDDALDQAIVCEGVDPRFLEAAAHATRDQKLRSLSEPNGSTAKTQRRASEATLAKRSCAGAQRLFTVVRGLNSDSATLARSLSEHLTELTLSAKESERRDTLVRALKLHAAALEGIKVLTTGPKGESLGIAISKLQKQIEHNVQPCLASEADMQHVDTSSAPSEESVARKATVMVRPVWPESVLGPRRETGTFGSGVLLRWNEPGRGIETRVVTNAHVVGDAEDVELLDADGLTRESNASIAGDNTKKSKGLAWKGRVVSVSREDDLAILRFVDQRAPEVGVQLRTTALKEEEAIVAVGFPGLGDAPSFQVTKGTISNAQFKSGESIFGGFLQHTAAIDPGNSGGPLLDGKGRLVGINTQKAFARENVGFAIPTARVILAMSRAGSKRSYNVHHAQALCDAFASTVSEMAAPSADVVSALSLSMLRAEHNPLDARMSLYVRALQGRNSGPVWEARVHAFAALRAQIDDAGGAPRMSTCAPVTHENERYEGTLTTRRSRFSVRITEESDALRIATVSPIP